MRSTKESKALKVGKEKEVLVEIAAEVLGKMTELKLQKFGGADAKPTARHQ